jgi:hypothetical protein
MSALDHEFAEIVRRVVREEVRAALADGGAGVAPRRLVTVAEYARTRSLSQSAVRAAIRTGRLAVQRIGRAIRIAADAELQRLPAATTGAAAAGRAARVLGLVPASDASRVAGGGQ